MELCIIQSAHYDDPMDLPTEGGGNKAAVPHLPPSRRAENSLDTRVFQSSIFRGALLISTDCCYTMASPAVVAQHCAATNLSECLSPNPQTLGALPAETGILGAAKRFHHFVFTELSVGFFAWHGNYKSNFRLHVDPRTNDWPFIASPWPGLGILAFYLIFCLRLGPWLMQNRKPFRLNRLLVVYNFVQVCASVWLFAEALDGAWLRHYSWKCQPVDQSNSPEAMRVARGVYVYFLLKLTELLDTVFFVLRKKERQISFLHLYHHTVMPMISWGATKYHPGGHGTFIGFINTGVHIIMYAYYLLSACGPRFEPYLWWKRYITRMQMGQFCLAFLHSMQLLWHDCGYPRWTVILILPNAVFFYYLFNDFYQQAYRDKQRAQRQLELAKAGKGKKE
ncbi:hypothetical protein B566_EDAN015575 [Ephemera danica]|nr:hypothetical protein B566_EDAN015575 [Ephemera danica]